MVLAQMVPGTLLLMLPSAAAAHTHRHGPGIQGEMRSDMMTTLFASVSAPQHSSSTHTQAVLERGAKGCVGSGKQGAWHQVADANQQAKAHL